VRNSRKESFDSIWINREFDSNVIDESDLQFEKQSESRISIVDDLEKWRINL
jgi:hypothetical protein